MTADLDVAGLPHRPPMQLLTDAHLTEPGHTLRARTPASGLDCYLLLESWLQAAALALTGGSTADTVLVGALRAVTVSRGTGIGEIAEHYVEVLYRASASGICGGHSTIGGERVLVVGQATIRWEGSP